MIVTPPAVMRPGTSGTPSGRLLKLTRIWGLGNIAWNSSRLENRVMLVACAVTANNANNTTTATGCRTIARNFAIAHLLLVRGGW